MATKPQIAEFDFHSGLFGVLEPKKVPDRVRLTEDGVAFIFKPKDSKGGT